MEPVTTVTPIRSQPDEGNGAGGNRSLSATGVMSSAERTRSVARGCNGCQRGQRRCVWPTRRGAHASAMMDAWPTSQ
jgi:hypothetical protein